MTLAMGMWRRPRRIRSQWISSDTTQRLYFSMIAAACRSSSSVHIRPVGFWGLHQNTSLHAGSAHLRSKSAKSASNVPSGRFFSGEVSTSTPAYSAAWTK